MYALRTVQWGMTLYQVRRAEGVSGERLTSGSLSFDVELAGARATLIYAFNAGALCSASFIVDHYDDEEDVATYGAIIAQMTADYGRAEIDFDHRARVRVELPCTRGALAQAVARGDFEINAYWKAPESQIVLALRAVKRVYNAFVMLHYWPHHEGCTPTTPPAPV